MTEIPLRLDPGISSLVRVGWVRAEPVRVAPAGPGLRAETAAILADLVRRHAGRSPAEIAALAPARELYRAFAIDPTRTRPSSEALLRRALRGLPFPEILNAVDVGNLCSVRFLLPIGLYDALAIAPPVTLRRGRDGESYEGIRKDEVHLAGRPVLVDAQRAFGNPTSDSAATRVTETTRSLWMTIFAPCSYPAERLERDAREAALTIERHLAGGEPVRTAHGVVD